MVFRVHTTSRYIISRTCLLLSGSSFIYGLQTQRIVLRNDSENREWPLTRQVKLKGLRTGAVASSAPEYGNSAGAEFESNREGKEAEDDTGAWAVLTSRLAQVGSAATSIQWSTIGDTIKESILPEWAQSLPMYVRKLQGELDMAPGSMADEIWQEASDYEINPEIAWNATVRISKDICDEERSFLQRRKEHTTQALGRYLGIPVDDINPEDVPTIAMCCSGGGIRALIVGAASYLSAQEDGLFDCVTYTAAVSGSCWFQTLYHSSLTGQNFQKLIHHLKGRLGVHIAFPPTALGLLTSAPTNKFLLSGVVEKLKGDPGSNFNVVDIYGLLLAARLLVPKGELGVDANDLKISSQRATVNSGSHPLPIYTAVRHEIPLEEVASDEEVNSMNVEAVKEIAKQEAWFQWFEITPYEFWCEELEAGIPTWSMGRRFQNGRSVTQENGLALPELRIPQLMGIWGSAFCATLSHYYTEIRPVLQGLALFSGLDEIIEGKSDDLIKVHPIEPAAIPNYVLGLDGQLPPTCPKSMYSRTHLQLMDAGLSNNLPIYPLLRPGRDVDIIIAFDSSLDIRTGNWLAVADGYAKQRGVKGWPIGVGWPKKDAALAAVEELEAAEASTVEEAATKLAEAQRLRQVEPIDMQSTAITRQELDPNVADLGHCTVWVGTTEERTSDSNPPQSKRYNAEADWKLLDPNPGIAVVYFPFIPNAKHEGVDPDTTDYMSTWNFIYTPDQIDTVVALATANFDEGKEQTRRCVRAVYERKKAARLKRETAAVAERMGRRLRMSGDHFR